MISKLLASVTAVTVAAGLTFGADTFVDTSIDAKFSLHAGETARVQAEQIEITFLAVTSDSRCGKGETCIWEGDAELQISVRIQGKDFGKYTLHTNKREGQVASFGSCHVQLVALSPSAIAGKTIAPDEYTAMLLIARGYAGNNGIL